MFNYSTPKQNPKTPLLQPKEKGKFRIPEERNFEMSAVSASTTASLSDISPPVSPMRRLSYLKSSEYAEIHGKAIA